MRRFPLAEATESENPPKLMALVLMLLKRIFWMTELLPAKMLWILAM
jgi:hypothetical protein